MRSTFPASIVSDRCPFITGLCKLRSAGQKRPVAPRVACETVLIFPHFRPSFVLYVYFNINRFIFLDLYLNNFLEKRNLNQINICVQSQCIAHVVHNLRLCEHSSVTLMTYTVDFHNTVDKAPRRYSCCGEGKGRRESPVNIHLD